MNGSDSENAYRDILDVLRNKGVGWIADQVEEFVAGGVTEEKQIEIHGGDSTHIRSDNGYMSRSDLPRKRRSRRKSSYLVQRDFDPQEKLAIAFSAIRDGISRVATMKSEIAEFALKNNVPTVLLVREKLDGEDTVVTLNMSKKDEWQRASRELESILDAAEKEID